MFWPKKKNYANLLNFRICHFKFLHPMAPPSKIKFRWWAWLDLCISTWKVSGPTSVSEPWTRRLYNSLIRLAITHKKHLPKVRYSLSGLTLFQNLISIKIHKNWTHSIYQNTLWQTIENKSKTHCHISKIRELGKAASLKYTDKI